MAASERKATTFRIDPVVKAGLAKLSKLTNASLNQLANEAIKALKQENESLQSGGTED